MLAPLTAPGTQARSGPDGLVWSNRFHALGPSFYTELGAEALPDPHWVAVSEGCAQLLGLPGDWWQREDWRALQVFSGHAAWPGMRSLASVYSGHQFGVWAGQLGDGRALWLGEVDTPNGPLELQLKGSGLTPYSRMGDGRAVLRSTIREFLCSEAMHGLGIPTTRALCVTGSALPVRRETVETAAVRDARGAQLHPLRPLRAFLRTTTSTTRCARWPTSSSTATTRMPRRRACPTPRCWKPWRGAPPR